MAESAKLLVKLNNHVFERELPLKFIPNSWTTIVCGVDVREKVVRLYVSGKDLPTIKLSKGFEFKVASSNQKEADKIWTLANCANASTFHGLVDELVIFDGMLTSEEMARLKLPLPTGQ